MKEKSIVTNRHGCIGGLWNKMSNPQRHFYNDLRDYTRKEICPINKEVSQEAFDVISHNFSYLGSCLVIR